MGHLNPSWNEPATDDVMNERFEQAMKLVGSEFTERVRFYRDVWWPARELVKTAINKRHEVRIALYFKHIAMFTYAHKH